MSEQAEKLSPTELEARLTPDHLRVPEKTEDLKKEIEQVAKAAEPPPRDDPRTKKLWPFEFEWEDGRGKVWKGSFVNRILSIKDRQLVGVMRARLAAGIPSESLDPTTTQINLMLAHMTFSLDEETRPDWAKDLRSIDNPRLLEALYEEVASHEATFFGL